MLQRAPTDFSRRNRLIGGSSTMTSKLFIFIVIMNLFVRHLWLDTIFPAKCSCKCFLGVNLKSNSKWSWPKKRRKEEARYLIYLSVVFDFRWWFVLTKQIGLFKVGNGKERQEYLSCKRTLMTAIIMRVPIFWAITTSRYCVNQFTSIVSFQLHIAVPLILQIKEVKFFDKVNN